MEIEPRLWYNIIATCRGPFHRKEYSVSGKRRDSKTIFFATEKANASRWRRFTRLKHICQKCSSIYRVQTPKVTPHVCRYIFCFNIANPKTRRYLMGRSGIGVALNAYLHLGFEDALEELKQVTNGEQQNGISKKHRKTPVMPGISIHSRGFRI